jgi:energy-coupling factor transporter transmembrane protein EcfT
MIKISGMETKRFSQFGTFSLIIMVPILIFCLIMMIISGIKDTAGFITLGFVSLLFLICLLIFYRITIYVNESFVMFSLGAGFIKKRYPVSDIKSCRPVRNSPLYGIGIRKIPKGWLYNVSGTGAVELTFKNKKSVVRIGTNEPLKVAEAINSILGNATYETEEDIKARGSNWYFLLLLFLALFLPAILIISGSRKTVVQVNKETLTIKDIYGLTLNYPDITELDTISVLPGIKSRTNGFAFRNVLKGNFKLTDNTRVKLYITKGNPPYIRIKAKELTIYLNLTDPSGTVSLFRQLQTMTNLQ